VGTNYSILLEGIFVLTKFVTLIRPKLGNGREVSLKGKTQYSSTPCANCLILWSIACTFLIENDAEILPVDRFQSSLMSVDKASRLPWGLEWSI